MEKKQVLSNTREYVRNHFEGEGTGHDWWHIHRVTEVAKNLANREGADLFICEMAALLHDVADDKLNESEEAGMKKVIDWLEQQHIESKEKEHILEIISTISFKGGTGSPVRTLEAQVVQDADRLDAIGAIGIARTFMYAGSKGSLIHDPSIEVRETMTKEEYRKGKSTAINHFYEKLLKLKDLMNTEAGKEMAEERHEYMVSFLQQFYHEWEGK